MILKPLATAAVLSFAAASADAATCFVDPTGTSGIAGAYASTQAALAGTCNTPGSVIELWCPAGGCADGSVSISGLSDITIRSQELAGSSGPVGFSASAAGPAVHVSKSFNIRFEGFDHYYSNSWAVAVEDSDVFFEGPGSLPSPRYSDVHGARGMRVDGASHVQLSWVGFSHNRVGLAMQSNLNGSPFVTGEGLAFVGNELAADLVGGDPLCSTVGDGPSLTIGGDYGVSWLNYVMGNTAGFQLRGSADLRMDHTLLANNLNRALSMGGNPHLISLNDASSFEGRNLLVYDNDSHGGLTGPYAGGVNTAGVILNHSSCGKAALVASTIINNATDLVFNIESASSGDLALDHVVTHGNWGKLLSMSSWYTSHGSACPPLVMNDTASWGDRVIADPATCTPPTLTTTWDPVPTVAFFTPRTVRGYPNLNRPRRNLYLINRRQPSFTGAGPAGLFHSRPWSVDGVNNDADARLDMGYHNPW
ncbi:MAG: hypothetical protein ACE366_19600 [Bradymonadia bacterium]